MYTKYAMGMMTPAPEASNRSRASPPISLRLPDRPCQVKFPQVRDSLNRAAALPRPQALNRNNRVLNRVVLH